MQLDYWNLCDMYISGQIFKVWIANIYESMHNNICNRLLYVILQDLQNHMTSQVLLNAQ